MKKQGTIMAALIIIAILISIGIFIFYLANKEIEANPNEKPQLDKKEIKNEFSSSLVNEGNSGGNQLFENQILGKWRGIYEEFIDSKNQELGNYSLDFKIDGEYEYIMESISEIGNYKISEDKIIFYPRGSNVNQPNSYYFAYAKFEGNNLRITFPKYPKAVVFEKE